MLALTLTLLAAPQAVDAREVFGTVRAPQGAEIVDLDRDGTPDLVFLDLWYGQVSWSRGLGGGEFASSEILGELFPQAPPFAISELVVADVNIDGQPDIVAARRTPSPPFDVAVAIVDPVTLDLVVTEVTHGSGQLNRMSVVDVTLDGLPDILFESATLRATYAAQLPGGGFATVQDLFDPPGTTVVQVVPADIDGDGDEDFAIPSVATPGGTLVAAWIENTGTPPFSVAQATVLGPWFNGFSSGDLDGDGDVDLVGLGPILQVQPFILENLGGSFAPARRIADGASFGGRTRVIDIDADGDLDVYSGQSLYFNDGTGSFVRQPGGVPELRTVADALADVDGDGIPDGLWADPLGSLPATVRINRGNLGPSGFGFVPGDNLNEGFGSVPVLPFHANGDAFPDLLVSNLSAVGVPPSPAPLIGWKRAVGNGEFARVEILYEGPVFSEPSYAAGDVDGDGDDDVLISEEGSADILFYENDGSGSFATPAVALTVTPTRFSRFLADDLNGDGRADVVFTGPAGAIVRYAFGQPDGTLSAPTTLGGASIPAADPVVIDLDDDSLDDLAIFGTSRLFWARNLGNGSFADPVLLLDGVPGDAVRPSRFIEDFDGDGILDVVLTLGGDVRVWSGLGGLTFALFASVDDGSQTVELAAPIDIDLDGDLDVVASYVDPGTGRELLAVAEQVSPNTLGGWQPIFAFDFRGVASARLDIDADGDDDLIFGEDRGGLVKVTTTTLGLIGEPYCGPAVPNSTGASGTTAATGSIDLALGELRLIAESLPPGQVGYFLASRTQQITPVVPNSIGTLCLGGEIGRFVGPGQVGAADAFGRLRLQADPAAIPSPSLGSVAIVAGERWNFQAWHRDSLGGSNFTEGLTVQY
ncbi:MAG: VCBS repeat-containing protein [Planctomycetota bacterium]